MREGGKGGREGGKGGREGGRGKPVGDTCVERRREEGRGRGGEEERNDILAPGVIPPISAW